MRPALVALVLAAVGCRAEPGTPAAPAPVIEPARGSAAPSAGPAADPWAVNTTPDPDAPPSLAERHRIAEQACPAVTAPYFYRIEKAGKISHILGTRHVGVPLAKFPRPVHDAIAAARLAVFELAPGDNSDVPDTEVVLSDELGPDLWKHYRQLVGPMVADRVAKTTPTKALLAMAVMYEDISASLDLEIQSAVQAAKIPTRGLETSAFQSRLLQQLLDLRMLRASIAGTEDRDEIEAESRKDLHEYCAGVDHEPGLDDDARADLLAAGYTEAELAKIDDEMVFARNAAWIPTLDKMLAAGGVFIAVGADHLTGPKGVVALLAKRGYTLTRITQ